jgi:hypothetical protein
MKSLAAPFRDLVTGRLWPLALILALAAVATPLLLADHEELPPAPVAAAPATGMQALQAALVAPAAAERGERRRVHGDRKDPFTPTGDQSHPRPEKPAATATPAASGGAPDTSGSFTGGGSSSPARPDTPSTPSFGGGGSTPSPSPAPAPAPTLDPPATTRPPAPTFALYSLEVRVNGEDKTLKRLDALPDADNPSAIYLGLMDDGKTAVFLVDEGVTAEGDGRCDPSPDDCQRVFLRKGETEFFSSQEGNGSAELQVDLVAIHTKRTRSARRARVARMAASSPGRRLLRARVNRVGRLRYNPRTGRLRLLSSHGWMAQVARAAAAGRQ